MIQNLKDLLDRRDFKIKLGMPSSIIRAIQSDYLGEANHWHSMSILPEVEEYGFIFGVSIWGQSRYSSKISEIAEKYDIEQPN